ncbi:MAG: hypothetical protein CBC29_10055 [Methylococcaceae bacterium TMED69]|mgnify:FL=1|nr:MAG: hypothetical protein CBC29_10055 [Methylococcaceae bacterium TMED69]
MKKPLLFTYIVICIFLLYLPSLVGANGIRKNHFDFFTLDSHVDTPLMLSLPGFDINKKYNSQNVASSIDYERLKSGGLDSAFWVIYSPQGPLNRSSYAISLKNAKRRVGQLMQMVSTNKDKFVLATSSRQLESLRDKKKHVVLMSIENAYPLGDDINNLDYFYKAGVRMLGIVHFSNNQFADSSTDVEGEKWGGLSPSGIALVKKANALGMIVDASHASDKATEQMIKISETPIILSHSGLKAVFDHPRNIDDSLLKKLAESGGAIQMNAYPSYLREIDYPAERVSALSAHYKAMYKREDNDKPMPFHEFSAGVKKIKKLYPVTEPAFQDFVKHLQHALKVVGPSHVGIGADWDGGGGVLGMEDVSSIPKITSELVNLGFSDKEIQSIWSDNVIRIFKEVEQFSRKSIP